MKKILSLGVASAVLSLTAVAASAAITPVVSDTAVEGEQIVVEVVANDFADVATQFTVAVSDNLTLVEYTKTDKGFADFNPDNMKFAWANTEAPADGTVLLTLVFDVNAVADEDVTVALTPDAGFEAGVNAEVVATTVVTGGETETDIETVTDSETVSDTVSETATDTETESDSNGIVDTDTATETSTATGSETDGGNGGSTTPDKTNPDSGIALAVVPAVLAGAAVVVAKKRK
ncbi:MAG: hypothetical protein ACI4XA_03775 [Oscillospiraceae bacterium]